MNPFGSAISATPEETPARRPQPTGALVPSQGLQRGVEGQEHSRIDNRSMSRPLYE